MAMHDKYKARIKLADQDILNILFRWLSSHLPHLSINAAIFEVHTYGRNWIYGHVRIVCVFCWHWQSLPSFYPEKLYELPCEWNYRVWLCSEVATTLSFNNHSFWICLPCLSILKTPLIPSSRGRTSVPPPRKTESPCCTATLSPLSRSVEKLTS